MRLSNLNPVGVRGIPLAWPAVEVGERGLIGYGHNGSGKSSLIDAIECALTGTATPFAEPRQGVNWENGGPHLRSARQPSPTVTLAGEFVVPSAAQHPEPVQAWLRLASAGGFILRRHKLLKFVGATPANRYAELEPFLDLEEFSRLEAGLKAEADGLSTLLAAAKTTASGLEQVIRTVFRLQREAPIVAMDLLALLNVVLGQAGVPTCIDLAGIAETQRILAGLLGGEELTQLLARLGALQGKLEHLALPSSFSAQLVALRDGLATQEAEVAVVADDVSGEFLEQTRTIISRPGVTACPSCEQDIVREDVLARLDQRLDRSRLVTAARRVVRERLRELRDPVSRLLADYQSLLVDWRRDMGVDVPPQYVTAIEVLSNLATLLDNPDIDSVGVAAIMPRVEAAVVDHGDALAMVREQMRLAGSGERRDHLIRASAMADSLANEMLRLVDADARIAALAEAQASASQLHEHAVEARKATVQTILNDVAETANRYYDFIHEDENIANSRLTVRAAEDGSVNLTTTFYGRETNPLVFLSESHLDTLGL